MNTPWSAGLSERVGEVLTVRTLQEYHTVAGPAIETTPEESLAVTAR